jgi:glycosyltransferase involved in cell wall biosynthesis
MRILIDFTGRVQRLGGGRTYPSYMLPRWQAHACDELFAYFSSGQIPEQLRTCHFITEFPRVTRWPPGQRFIDLNVRIPVRAIQLRPDVVYFPGSLMSLRLPPGARSVVSVRATVVYHYPYQLSAARRRYLRLTTRHAARAATRIIVPSSATADDMMRFAGAPREKLIVIPHGIDLERFKSSRGGDHEPTAFLFVSRPYDYKGLATVCRAVKELRHHLPDLRPVLRVADGGVSARQGKRLVDVARAVGVEDDIAFLGAVDHDRLAGMYRTAAALVLPTSIESFGNMFLEAAASGCPIITARGHGIDETVGGVARFIPAHDHRRLAEAMREVYLMDGRQREDLSASLRHWASRFSWDRTLDETREVLAEAAWRG